MWQAWWFWTVGTISQVNWLIGYLRLAIMDAWVSYRRYCSSHLLSLHRLLNLLHLFLDHLDLILQQHTLHLQQFVPFLFIFCLKFLCGFWRQLFNFFALSLRLYFRLYHWAALQWFWKLTMSLEGCWIFLHDPLSSLMLNWLKPCPDW